MDADYSSANTQDLQWSWYKNMIDTITLPQASILQHPLLGSDKDLSEWY